MCKNTGISSFQILQSCARGEDFPIFIRNTAFGQHGQERVGIFDVSVFAPAHDEQHRDFVYGNLRGNLEGIAGFLSFDPGSPTSATYSWRFFSILVRRIRG